MTIDSSIANPNTSARLQITGARRVTGIAGEVLIALGVIVALYVVWQLLYTDIIGQRSQQGLLETLEWVDTVNPVTAGGTGENPDSLPDVIQLIPPEFQYRDVAPEAIEPPPHATTFGAFYVPRWGQDYVKPISEGVTRRDVLDRLGIGRYPGTAMPGGLGNFAIAGHRTTYGKPFSAVDTLQLGDALVVQTEDAWFVYRVTSWGIVRPIDTDVIAPVPGQLGVPANGRYITLTTCHPRYSAAQRWIVHGELEYWAPTGIGFPPELVEDLS